MMEKYTVEINGWRNKELGLYYAENRAFYNDDILVESFLDVCDEDGRTFELGDLIESNRGKDPLSPDYKEVTVDDVEWELVELHHYFNEIHPKSLFINARSVLESVKNRMV